MTRLALAIATAGGAGFVPIAPGTAGSAVGILVYWLTRQWSSFAQFGVLAGVCLVGVWASSRAAEHFQRNDPGYVVIDEVAGQLMTLFLLGVGAIGALVGFVLFRVLDVVKPWPVRRLEALPGGLGIMADDIAAGVIGWIVMQVVVRVVPGIA